MFRCMRRTVRNITKVVIGLLLLSSAVWAFALQDNWVAVMRNSSMEPAVPMGALVVANDADIPGIHLGGRQVGDVVIYFPPALPKNRYPLATLNRLHRLVFGTQEVARQGGGFLYADDQPTVRLPSLDPSYAESMKYYIPLVGYPLWFGPVEPLSQWPACWPSRCT